MSRAPRHESSAVRLLLCIPFICMFFWPFATAIDENLTKGATNNHIFESWVWGENIDLLNGGLNLTIPIGPTFRVSSDVSYQLKLAYSTKIWHIESPEPQNPYWGGNQRHRARSRLDGRGQAGLGFMLQMGRFMTRANSVECDSDQYSRLKEDVFEDSTGAVHQSDYFTRGAPDGSFIRARSTDVQMPDGTRYLLGQHVNDLLTPGGLGWPKCSSAYPPLPSDPNAKFDIWTNDYRGEYVTQIEGKDRVGGQAVNKVVIEYETAAGMRHLMKKITNYRNGVADTAHAITFINSNADPTAPNNTLEMGYVKSVTVPVFSSDAGVVRTATYTFNYTLADVWDPWVNPSDPNDPYRAQDNLDNKFEKTLLLTGIDFPATADGVTPPVSYRMSFQYTGTEWQGHNIGYVQARELPTGASIEYDYRSYAFRPEVCSSSQGGQCPPIGSCIPNPGMAVCTDDPRGWTQGIGSKRIIAESGGPAYTWVYEREAHAVGRPNPAAVVTTDPFGNDTITYFHADSWDPYSITPNGSYYYHNKIWKNGRSYKTEYYRGSSANPGNLVRSEQQVWADDVFLPNDPDFYKHWGEFPRIVESSVTYHDDGGKTSRTVNEEWDGFGNFRKVTEYGFDGLAYRVTRADSNCDRRDPNNQCLVVDEPSDLHCDPAYSNYNCPLSPGHWNNWVLGTKSYSQTEDAEGHVLQRTEFAYDPDDGDPNNDVGYLRSRKDLLTIPQGVDLVGPFGNPSVGSAGDVKTEFTYEGDPTCPSGAASYATGNVCLKTVSDYGLTPAIFQEQYTYAQAAYLKSRQVVGLGWKSEDRDVDEATGLTRVSRDPNGIQTTLGYDSLGRLISVTPDARNGTENPATLTYPDIWTTELEQQVSSSDKIFSRFKFDTLGRLKKIEKRQTDGTMAAQFTGHDIAGRVTYQSEWGDPNTVEVADPNKGTTFDYTDPASDPENPTPDPFGRVRRTITADQKVTLTDYWGASSAVTVEGIKTGLGPNSPTLDARTVYEKDAFGRLAAVISHRTYPQVGPALAAGADAYYGYDRLDRLTSVRLDSQNPNTFAFIPQYRNFAYNALGQQTSATNPENGTVRNLLYDAAGNLKRRQDASGNLFEFDYDAASRLVAQYVTRPGAGQTRRTLVQNTYDEHDGTFGYGLGHLTTQVSLDEAGHGLVQQQWRYNGLNGRLSEADWQFGGWAGDPNASLQNQMQLSMTYAYNVLGLASSVNYPNRLMVGSSALSLQMTYANGALVGVTDPVRGALVETIGYNLAGGVNKIRTQGGVETLIAPDVRNRPASITVTKQGATPVTHFASGAYAYDGAGNISSIGNDKFAYDALSRLVAATVNDTAGGKIEGLTWTYDPLGNMVYQRRGTTSTSGTTVATNWFNMDRDPNNQVVPNKNQILTYGVTREGGLPSDPSAALHYDANGNLTLDRNYEYIFDTRNRLAEVRKTTDGSVVARYAYDALGNRLSKFDVNTGLTTFYVRDAGGQVMSEYRRPDVPGRAAKWLKDYVYAAGRHVAMMENEAPAVPRGITVQRFEPGGGMPDRIMLTWEPTGDLDLWGYHVRRSGGPWPDDFETEYAQLIDTTVQTGTTYTYRIRSIDQVGTMSDSSEPVVVTPGDQMPPSAPGAGAITAGDRKVDLAWTAPTNADLWSFQLYRKLSSESTYQAVGPLLHKSQTYFTDTSVGNDVEYDYQVKAFDTSGLASSPAPATTGTWRVTPRDLTPPEVPQGFYAVAGAAAVNLFWRASTSSDFEKFQVFRATQPIDVSAPGTALAQPTVPQVTDASLVASNTRYYYRVRALDHKNNASALSGELIVDTKDSVLPKPTALSAVSWSYSNSGAKQLATYLPYNTPPAPGSSEPMGYYSHENHRDTTIQWSAGTSGATLDGFRLYGRHRTDEPWELWRELPPNLGCEAPLPDPYVPPYPLVPFPRSCSDGDNYYHLDFGFNPQDRCQDTFLRVSTIGKVNQMTRESELTAVTTTQPGILTRPENLMVPAEPFDANSPTLRLEPEFYGLTLNWAPGASVCDGVPVGYHVYRNRSGGVGPMIRLTKQYEPIQAPTMRVEFLPLSDPNFDNPHTSCPTYIFDGPRGYHSGQACPGDACPFVYAVTSVDSLGNESALSNKISAHTDAMDRTDYWGQSAACYQEAKNTELSNIPLTIPDPNSLAFPNPVVGSPTWAWKYGPDPNSDVGPEAGNWALVKWVQPANQTANDFRLQAKRAADPNWAELDLDLIPGDDWGIRQFIWAMPLELACEDANYQVVGVDYFGVPSNPSAPFFGPKRKLIPENVWAVGTGTQVIVSWDPLPLCGQDPTHVLTGYTLLRSRSYDTDCSGVAPAEDPNLYDTVSSATFSATSLTSNPPEPTSRKYWYRVYASWGQSGPSGWSPGVCKSANDLTSEILQPMVAPSMPADPGASWKLAQLAEPVMSVGDCWRGEGSGICEIQLLPTSCDATRGPEQSDVMSQVQRLVGPSSPEGAPREPDAESPHRIIGQGELGAAERLTFYHVDHLGTPRVITDPNGNVVSIHKYLPFGEELSAPPSSNTHEFTGHERDAETGLDYMLARYYGSGSTLRFLSPDPISVSEDRLETPARLNGYAYAANNPLKYLDPDGQDIELSSKGNGSAAKSMLIETAMRPSGRDALQKIDSDHSITVTVEDSRINTPEAIQQTKQTGGELTTEKVSLEKVSVDAQGNEHKDVKMQLDTKAIDQAHPDPSGVTSTAHGLYHVEGHQKGQTDAQIKAGDKPTPSTGPAAAKGQSVGSEKPDISKKEAKKVVNQMLKN